MEVIINDKTFTLLPLNKERRDLFCQIVCNPPKLDEKNQKRYLYALQQQKQKNWLKKIFKPKEFKNEKKWLENYIKRQEKKIIDPLYKYNKEVKKCLWAFLKSEDKKCIGNYKKFIGEEKESLLIRLFYKITGKTLGLSNKSLENWQKQVVSQIEKTIKYFSEKEKNIATTNQKDTVEAFLVKNGYNREEVRNMNSIDLFEAIDGAMLENERARVVALNDRALAGAYAKGSRDSLNAIKRINNDFKRKSTKPIKMTKEQEQELNNVAWDLYLEKLTKGHG